MHYDHVSMVNYIGLAVLKFQYDDAHVYAAHINYAHTKKILKKILYTKSCSPDTCTVGIIVQVNTQDQKLLITEKNIRI